jgi:hypothetical protein
MRYLLILLLLFLMSAYAEGQQWGGSSRRHTDLSS